MTLLPTDTTGVMHPCSLGIHDAHFELKVNHVTSPAQPDTTHSTEPKPVSRGRTVPARQLRTVMAGVLLAMALAALDQNIVNTALPRMAPILAAWPTSPGSSRPSC